MEESDHSLESLLPLSNLTTPHHEYLRDLTAYNLLALRNEPHKLEQEQINNVREMEELACNNYKTFIYSRECTTLIHKEIKGLGTDVSELQTHLPELSTTCQDFVSKVKDISAKRKVTSTALRLHGTLLELLEIPQLMESCVKSQYYDEALELEQYAKKLLKEYPNIPILKQLSIEVEALSEMMVNQLHKQLSGPCNLSDSFKIISHLKKLGIYGDHELKIAFLRCRDEHMEHVLSLIPSTNYFMHISKMIDSSRAELTEIVNQYSTLFGENPADYHFAKKQYILQSWVFFKVNQFLERLQRTLLQTKDASFLSNILTSCMFFGKSLERMGCDFRGIIPPIFEAAILQIFQRDLSRAVINFGNLLKKYKNLSAHQGLQEYTPAPDPSEVLPVPVVFLDFPPLAILTNAILAIFNDLRTCWFYSLQKRIATLLENQLLEMAEKLTQHKASVQSTLLPNELQLLEKMCQVTHSIFVPFIGRCLELIFSSRDLINVPKIQEPLSMLFKPEPAPVRSVLDVPVTTNQTTEQNGEAEPKENQEPKQEAEESDKEQESDKEPLKEEVTIEPEEK